MPQNTQQSLCTFPTSQIQAAVRIHGGKEDVKGRCGHPVHTPGHGMDVTPIPTELEPGLEELLVGNRQ